MTPITADLWNAEDEWELAVGDVSAGSKYLISTRVRGLLDDSHCVEIKLPTEQESVHILMATAGAQASANAFHLGKSEQTRAPSGAVDIVRHCARLPLALGIAGRLINSLGMAAAHDWTGLVDILKEELRASTSGGIEESCIRATLRSLKGSAAEQKAINSVLLLMAIVPEDTALPLEVLQVMYDATTVTNNAAATRRKTSIMKIRKYLRVLLDRSLVLGSVDRPSVHDLVLDFVVAQHSEEELREKHRQVVEAFRACRPMNSFGVREWERGDLGEDSICRYIGNEVAHHVRGALPADPLNDAVVAGWLGDTPQDAITVATAEVLGWKAGMQLARQADEQQDWWSAARRWSLAGMVVNEMSECDEYLPNCSTRRENAMELWRYAMTSLAQMDESMLPVAAAVRAEKDALELGTIFRIFGDKFPADIAAYTPQAVRACKTEAAAIKALDTSMVIACTDCFPAFFAPDVPGVAKSMVTFVNILHGARDSPDKLYRQKCLISACAWHGCFATISSLQPEINSRLDSYFGEGGSRIVEAAEVYYQDPIAWLRFYTQREGDDKWLFGSHFTWVLGNHYGDLANAGKFHEKNARLFHKLRQENDPTFALSEANLIMGLLLQGLVFGWGTDSVQGALSTLGLDYDEVGQPWNNVASPNIRP
eukprot:SAG22_NODE_300_length_12752_cov_3.102426_1_plen_653_part_10